MTQAWWVRVRLVALRPTGASVNMGCTLSRSGYYSTDDELDEEGPPGAGAAGDDVAEAGSVVMMPGVVTKDLLSEWKIQLAPSPYLLLRIIGVAVSYQV